MNLTLKFGLHYHLKGDNGSGKSTLFKGLLGSMPSLKGAVEVERDGTESIEQCEIRNLDKLLKSMFYIPQITEYMFPLKTCAMTYLRLLDKSGLRIDEARNKYQIFDKLLCEIEWRHSEHISGGQRQLLALLAMHISDSEVVLLDEPTSQISSRNTDTACELIKEYISSDKIIIFSTHCNKLQLVADETIQVN
nr:ATP-binding cassette domain-containing protein [Pseudoalteromonas peptidolytica]